MPLRRVIVEQWNVSLCAEKIGGWKASLGQRLREEPGTPAVIDLVPVDHIRGRDRSGSGSCRSFSGRDDAEAAFRNSAERFASGAGPRHDRVAIGSWESSFVGRQKKAGPPCTRTMKPASGSWDRRRRNAAGRQGRTKPVQRAEFNQFDSSHACSAARASLLLMRVWSEQRTTDGRKICEPATVQVRLDVGGTGDLGKAADGAKVDCSSP